jgi:hypothetical protein
VSGTTEIGAGEHVAAHYPELHTARCRRCGAGWRAVASPSSWFGVCAGCGSDGLVVESRVVPGTTSTESLLRCPVCAATWIGQPGEDCGWCLAAVERQRAEQRRRLLWPDQLPTGDDGPPHEQLSELDRRVWDTTRGQRRGEGARRAWIERLARAVTAGLITRDEATAAVQRQART